MISAVLAAWDERENVEPLTRRLAAVLDGLAGPRWEIVYVVEGTDGTKDVLETLAGEIPGIRVLYQPEPQGLGAAFRRGFAAAATSSSARASRPAAPSTGCRRGRPPSAGA